MHTLAYWEEQIGLWARSKGWYHPDKLDSAPKIAGRNALELCALMSTEISEAVEAARMNQMQTYTDTSGKPQGFYSELADCVIRIMDCFAAAGVSLEDEISLKMNYNATRPDRHGGKLA